MIIIYQKNVVIFEPSNEEGLKDLVIRMIGAVKKWQDEGRPKSGDFA